MKVILRAVQYEFENLFLNRGVWILMAAYVMLTFVICLSDSLRLSYFSFMESISVLLLNFVAPVFLVFILISTLSPVFAGDTEQKISQIPTACLIGRKGRSIAKFYAAVIFSLVACLIIGFISFLIPFCCNLFDGDFLIKYVGTELKLAPIWTVWQHFVFSMISIVCACIILVVLILFISCSVKNTITVVSISSIFVLLEFLFNRFSFPTIVQEYNIWVLFQPYYLFVMKIFHFLPIGNLLLLLIAFLPLCVFALQQIVRRGV